MNVAVASPELPEPSWAEPHYHREDEFFIPTETIPCHATLFSFALMSIFIKWLR